MIGYFWTNMYLSPIQRGIQVAHCVAQMAVSTNQYMTNIDVVEHSRMFSQWALKDQTLIIFNGGSQENLKNILDVIVKSNIQTPFDCFHESEESLNNALTCVGFIGSDLFVEVLNSIKILANENDFMVHPDNDWYELIHLIKHSKLA